MNEKKRKINNFVLLFNKAYFWSGLHKRLQPTFR